MDAVLQRILVHEHDLPWLVRAPHILPEPFLLALENLRMPLLFLILLRIEYRKCTGP